MKKNRIPSPPQCACLLALLIPLFLLSSCFVHFTFGDSGRPDDSNNIDGRLHFEDGMAQPLLEYSDMDTPNEESDIQRFCVYVETDHDTDGDGKADLVKAFVQVPKSAAAGKYQAAAIYDPMPYPAGVFLHTEGYPSYPYADSTFDYDKLYKPGKKRTPAGELATSEAAAQANSEDWIYSIPGDPEMEPYYNAKWYNYYLIRGFAIVLANGIGTYGSEGYELCGSDLERDAHRCVVEWLTGDRVAYSDKEQNLAIRADWCNGKVAMTGISYGGTLPYEVATTGVKGLETIVPVAGIANWYDYTNSQGVSTYSKTNYTDYLASYNAGAAFKDDDWTVTDDNYGAWLHQIAADEQKANGNYTDVWAGMDYSVDTDAIDCPALIVHGLNDFNVLTKESDLMYRAFKRSHQNVKLLFHQDGHNRLFGTRVGDQLFDELLNKWLSHYLYDVDNGIENMAEVTVQSNLDGTFRTCDAWGRSAYRSVKALQRSDSQNRIQSGKYDDFYEDYLVGDVAPEQFYQSLDSKHAAVYTLDVPQNATVYGIPEVHVKLSTEDVDQDDLMVSAMLMDVEQNGADFPAYMLKHSLGDKMPRKTIGSYEIGTGYESGKVKELVQSPTTAKVFSKGWMDLLDPGAGYISSENKPHAPLRKDTFYDYTLYLTPTVYTMAKGHQLKLLLFAQDPYRSRNDDTEDATPGFNDDMEDAVYSFTVDNASVDVRLPLADVTN